MFRYILIGLICLLSQFLKAHGDLHMRIQAVSKQIIENPDSTYLYLKRGILFFQHEEYNESLKDLNQCEQRNFNEKLLDLTFAKVYHKIGEFEKSLTYLNKLIENDNGYVHAWRLKGQVLFEQKKYDDAFEAYKNVIEKAIRRLPSNYIDASLSSEFIVSNKGKQTSISIINDGIKDLGPLMTFYDRLVYLGLKYEDFDLAVESQNKIIKLSRRKETPLYKRAQIYIKFNDLENAKKDLVAANQALDSLHKKHKNTAAMIELQQQINFQIENL